MKYLNVAVVAISLGATSLAFAEHEKGHHMMESADTNKDGSVSEDEFLSFHKDHFKKLDKDSNGSIDKEEMKEMRKKMHHKKMKKYDNQEDQEKSE